MQATSRDAYVVREGNVFRIGTDTVEKTVALSEGGCFEMTGYLNKLTGSQYISGGAQPSDEFAITINGTQHAGSDGGWQVTGVPRQARSRRASWK